MAHVLETLTSRAVERQSEEADEAGVFTGGEEEPGSEEIGAGTEGAKVVAGNGAIAGVAIATFAAVRNGIFVAFSVGNSWPDEGSLVLSHFL
ncbi:uncharacterized protein A4U43_C07F5580 [Asparagus officinalis]|uniref:Uncharacterized protein n=1 Tax=Asparagus officinalis TaxID=4686 RepID=A0A5P1ECR6_ASPOF|nr:uncharacterized protein A4U43_C07F5580 [Asparagus officinalis]